MKIKVIPMNKELEPFYGMEIKEAQKYYFEGILINSQEDKYTYYYSNHGINAEEGDLLLFQYDNHIIASAILKFNFKYRKDYMKGITGHLELKENTIKTFKPISKEEMKKYIPSFKYFSRSPLEYSDKIVNVEALLKRLEIK